MCTTIIESGLDVPSANTLVVERADRLGLAQLYQLRGRVGRSADRAFAYLFFPTQSRLTEEAHERLSAISRFTALGSGFSIAMKDLEIRGAGNLLGAEQHGHIAAVGFDTYLRLLSESVAEMKGEPLPPEREVRIDLPVKAFIPPEWVGQEALRLELYRRIATARDAADLDQARGEAQDRFGDLPQSVLALFAVASLRLACLVMGIEEVSTFRNQVRIKPVEEATGLEVAGGRLGALAITRPPGPLNLDPPPRLGGEALALWVRGALEEQGAGPLLESAALEFRTPVRIAGVGRAAGRGGACSRRAAAAFSPPRPWSGPPDQPGRGQEELHVFLPSPGGPGGGRPFGESARKTYQAARPSSS